MGQAVSTGYRSLFYLLAPSELNYATLKDLEASTLHSDLVANATPFFFTLAALEIVVGWLKHGVRLYRINDATMSMNLGMCKLFLSTWSKGAMLQAYVYIHQHCRLISLDPTSKVCYVLSLLAVDLNYYWFHRWSHEFHLGFLSHMIHHSGEDYNLMTALRQGSYQFLFGFFFTLPLAFFVPPVAMVLHNSLNLLYQFYIHTTLVGRLTLQIPRTSLKTDFLEYILNTPSHHRVHHRPGAHCNYGAVLVIWDRIFGTFVPEREQLATYGLGKTIPTFDPVVANFHGLIRRANQLNLDSKNERSTGFPKLLLLLWKVVSQRRIHQPLVFRPEGLIEPLPEGNLSKLPEETHENIIIRKKRPRNKKETWYKYDGLKAAKSPLEEWMVAGYSLFLQAAILAMFLAMGKMSKQKVLAATWNNSGLALLLCQVICLLYCHHIAVMNDHKSITGSPFIAIGRLSLTLFSIEYFHATTSNSSIQSLLAGFQTMALLDALFWVSCQIILVISR